MNSYLNDILDRFDLDSAPVECRDYGCGHINATYKVSCASGRHYILQKINSTAFKDVQGLMQNISAVTEYLKKPGCDPRTVMSIVRTKDGKTYIEHQDGSFWRVYDFIEDAICLQSPESERDFYESAVAFGSFQQQLKDFPAETLHESIPNFHSTPDRYRIFRETLKKDVCGRAGNVGKEIEFVLGREKGAGILIEMLKRGELPLRVTHNDTKLNNVMLDRKTRKALCVIDLDTVMPGLSLYDFGDSIRFGAATAAEDEQDLSRMELDLKLFRIYTEGFLSACPGLTAREREMLPEGARIMTLECGLRFLTDYLDGDHYFSIQRPGQNLDRARTQFKLVYDMERKMQQMQDMVKSLSVQA